MQTQSQPEPRFQHGDVVETPDGPGTVREIVRRFDGTPLEYGVQVPNRRRRERSYRPAEMRHAVLECA